MAYSRFSVAYSLIPLARTLPALFLSPPPRISVLILRCCFLASISLFALPLQAQDSLPGPTNFRVTSITHDNITMRWDPLPGATSYEVAREFLPFSPYFLKVGNVTSYTFAVLPRPPGIDAYEIFGSGGAISDMR